ncbi:hypothetical protein Tco_0069665, partial [Tanacetum coccineum]
DAPSSGIPPPLPISVLNSSPPLLLPSASHREDIPEVTLPLRKRLSITLGPRYEIMRDSEREVGYGITESWDEIVETLQGEPVRTDTELGRHMIAFKTRVRQDTYDIYTRIDDEQSQRQLLAGRINMLQSMDTSDLAYREVMLLRTIVLGQMLEIRELPAADHRRQAVTSEMLKADHRRSAKMRELRTADHTR